MMGERGAASEDARPQDIAEMAESVKQGIAAGALGFSISRPPARPPARCEAFELSVAAQDDGAELYPQVAARGKELAF